MPVNLKGAIPPFLEVADLGYAVLAVYSLLYQSAYQDQRFEVSKKPWELRRDCGGLTHWSHKAIADKLGMGKKKVITSIDCLLDNYYLQVAGYQSSAKGSSHRIYRVTHPDDIPTLKEVYRILGYKPSERAKLIQSSERQIIEQSDCSIDLLP